MIPKKICIKSQKKKKDGEKTELKKTPGETEKTQEEGRKSLCQFL